MAEKDEEKKEGRLSEESCGVDDSMGLHVTASQIARFNPKELEEGGKIPDPGLLNLVLLSRQYLTKLLEREVAKL